MLAGRVRARPVTGPLPEANGIVGMPPGGNRITVHASAFGLTGAFSVGRCCRDVFLAAAAGRLCESAATGSRSGRRIAIRPLPEGSRWRSRAAGFP
jgi:hypothetical protein